MDYKDWTEMPHPIWGIGGREEKVHELVSIMTFPKTVWRKGKFSIIPPCTVTFDMWELYDGGDIERFPTLEEAKAFADAQMV